MIALNEELIKSIDFNKDWAPGWKTYQYVTCKI